MTIGKAACVWLLVLSPAIHAGPVESERDFPVQAELFIDEFTASEGITFNAQGQLFIAADRGVWRAYPNGNVVRLSLDFSEFLQP